MFRNWRYDLLVANLTSHETAIATEAASEAKHKSRQRPGRRVCDPVVVARLREQGFTREEIARLLQVSGSTVARALRETGIERPNLPDDPRDPSAVATLRGLLLSADERIRLRAAGLLLSNSERVQDAALIQPETDSGDDMLVIRVPREPVMTGE
jgi:AraC-like DNA-binding protein